nr:reverse transcriptase domain-containing protein [Tanacetum cinerariifolium]
MTTRSVGRPTAAARGGTSGRAGRGGGRTRGYSCDQSNGGIGGQGGQVGGQGSEVNDGSQGNDQGNGRNQNSNAINDNIRGDVRNVIGNNNRRICTFKEFLACNPKEYDGKGGVIAYTHWIEKMESVQDVSGCELKTIQKAVQAGTLTDEALRNGSIKKNPEKRGNKGEPYKDRNAKDDNKRTRTGNDFPTTNNHVRRENTGAVPKCTTCNTDHQPEAPCRTCFNSNRPCHFAKDCRVVPRNVSPINARNPTTRACYECGSTDHIKSAFP